jgi:propionyl-CoA synthetase
MNTVTTPLDRHVERGRADQPALIYDSGYRHRRTFTYRELRDRVARFAGALAAHWRRAWATGSSSTCRWSRGGDRDARLCAAGAIHSVVGSRLRPRTSSRPIEDAKPKVIVSASCGIEPARLVEYKPLLDAAIDMAESKPQR